MPGLGLSIPELAAARRGWTGFAFDGGALPAGATLTRASGGAYWSGAGVLATAAADVARFDGDPATGAARGLLIEPAATNLQLASEALDSAATWSSAVNIAITANAATAPGGAATADLIVPTTVAATHSLAPNGAAHAYVAGTTYTRSIHAKPAGYRYLRMALPAAIFAPGPNAVFDLTGKVAQFANCGGGIEDVGNGWLRLTITATATASATGNAGSLAFHPASYGLSPDASVGDGTSGILLWGAQCEAGVKPSSYVATGGGAATRAADALTLNWGARGVPDGAATIRYTFDDGSSQDVATTIAGGTAGVPSDLNRRWLTRADKL